MTTMKYPRVHLALLAAIIALAAVNLAQSVANRRRPEARVATIEAAVDARFRVIEAAMECEP